MNSGSNTRDHTHADLYTDPDHRLQRNRNHGYTLACSKGRVGEKNATTLTAALETPWKEFLLRPARPLHSSRYKEVFEFLSLQFQATVGTLPMGDHIVYMMLAGGRA